MLLCLVISYVLCKKGDETKCLLPTRQQQNSDSNEQNQFWKYFKEKFEQWMAYIVVSIIMGLVLFFLSTLSEKATSKK